MRVELTTDEAARLLGRGRLIAFDPCNRRFSIVSRHAARPIRDVGVDVVEGGRLCTWIEIDADR